MIPTFQRPLAEYLGIRVDGVSTAPLVGVRPDLELPAEVGEVKNSETRLSSGITVRAFSRGACGWASASRIDVDRAREAGAEAAALAKTADPDPDFRDLPEGGESVEVAGPRPISPSDIASLCAEKGLRITDQRRTIAKVLSEADDHPDVDALHRRAAKVDPNISIATVYRTVRLFDGAGGDAEGSRSWSVE